MTTAEKLILKHCNTKTNDYGTFFGSISELQCKNAMIEFAKIHVELALKEASEKAEIHSAYGFERVNKGSILKAYPLENIK